MKNKKEVVIIGAAHKCRQNLVDIILADDIVGKKQVIVAQPKKLQNTGPNITHRTMANGRVQVGRTLNF